MPYATESEMPFFKLNKQVFLDLYRQYGMFT